MKQMTFTDAEYAGKRKQTRKKLFLIEMDSHEYEQRGARGAADHLFTCYLSQHRLTVSCGCDASVDLAKKRAQSLQTFTADLEGMPAG
ncbi:hypothetical protein [Pseudomonas aeruginosa]|uniref:Uncharacterized protein ORF SG32 n=1 Tax=Pseudomonas aeruginosa TaxID=287 RepID=Q8GPX0_PSEAI|nr:hypothetical protein [Pseudomonas aeruginosa]AAN62254.1 hypothetical protein [Pseudomonas aeruginosa]EWH28580.1 transposase [Pseudomonas aeruginosa SG17M]KSR73896.1 hypothetical protein APB55_17605 [Pseudomonas aeruginosa]RPU87617.1 hypothetical protein IPC881_07445 [Pseudomonas aeruginosa]UFK75747.1 hypothetical protein K0E51_12385 [Pseudomonas aeruginosa SG17M]